MNHWTLVDPATGELAPPGVDPGTGRYAPSPGAAFCAAAALVGVVAYAGVVLWTNRFDGLVVALPVLAGAIVGALSLRRPFRNALWLLAGACGLWMLLLGGYAIFALFYSPLAAPPVLAGALCGHTLRRFARARRFERWAAAREAR